MKFTNVVAIVVLAAIALAASMIGYWVFQPVPECTVTSNVYTVDGLGGLKTQFKPGETLRIKRDLSSVCKMVFIKVWRTVSHKHSHEVVASDEFLPVPIKGTGETRTSAFRLPLTIPPGVYVYRVFITHQINPLRDGTFEMMPPVEFEVIL